jgi:hypothetical protein
MSRRIILPCLVLLTAGCSSWRLATAPPNEVVQRQASKTIQVLTIHDTTVVRAPYLANDSLLGQIVASRGRNHRYAVALPDVLQIKVRHFDAGKSLLAVAAVAGAVT